MLQLTDDIAKLKGIGNKKKQALSAHGIVTVGDLLNWYPVRYKDRRNVIRAIEAAEDRDCLVSGELRKIQIRPLSGRRSLVECTLNDGSCVFFAAFFNMPYLRKSLKTGSRYILFGKMKNRNGRRVWVNPEMSIEGSERDIRGIIPVYRSIAGVSNPNLTGLIKTALAETEDTEDWIGSGLLSERRLCDQSFAFRNIHFPQSERHYKAARYRIIYEQLLLYQLAVRLSRMDIESDAGDSSIEDADITPFIDSLPFALTEGQERCIKDIEADMTASRPMNRLVQGDVGCGKTVVAEAAIYKCAAAGLQSAMMAPTEILARQHYERLSEDLGKFGMSVVLLTSGMKAAERREILGEIADGTAKVVVGTHAVIQKDVIFSDLGLVITDEQHRFGVNQRKLLARKGRGVNVCVMSATPIPRTLAATVFGDMDFSIIRTRPADRKTIITRALTPDSRERAYTAVRRELEAGNLAYIVAPSIDSEDDDMSSVMQLYNEICERFKGYKAALLHGRMGRDEKEAVMNDFASGKSRILVATVVVEVGIDVSDATIMVIENSERFGLAQMHQLRGRVGRSNKQSYCYLINYSKSENAAARAKAMAEMSDGFEISEEDYRLRGPGDIMGTMQSGNYSRDILMLCRYTDILELAMQDADRIIADPSGTDMDHVRSYMESAAQADNSDIL
ncbi:MAG: ATP-dependent DNA helicase RecG [Clostridiales bacterium]|nr:ATP-dependent DNA helicase RecG [Clostridiales bacterium]